MLLSFGGAAGTVTGSCYWGQTDRCQFLVDCGMFQGSKTLKELNYGPFPFDPEKIDFVLLTHAHIDHSGLIPKLVKQGFRGQIFTTQGTFDLLTYMLPDSGYIHEMEVEWLNRRNAQRGRPAVAPIYSKDDAHTSLQNFNIVDYQQWRDVGEGVRARFWNAGHILGSASIEVEVSNNNAKPRISRLLFSGDIGPEHKLFHPDPDAPDNFDFVCCEATYGGRKRVDASAKERRKVLGNEVRTALARGGNLLIPSFAVERTQELLMDFALLMDAGEIPTVPVFLDSPLAIKATEVFVKNADTLEYSGSARDVFNRPNVRFTETVDESKMIARIKGGAIIMAGSGMCDAGRIRHHLKHNLWRSDATLLLVGYQAPGTLGALLSQGAKSVKIQGETIKVKAAIREIDLYSGHADGAHLVSWVKDRLPVKSAIFLTHGNASSLDALRKDLEAANVPPELIVVPQLDDTYQLMADNVELQHRPKPRRLSPDLVTDLDWHNDLAGYSLRLRELLDAAADDKSRKIVMRKIVRTLEELEKK